MPLASERDSSSKIRTIPASGSSIALQYKLIELLTLLTAVQYQLLTAVQPLLRGDSVCRVSTSVEGLKPMHAQSENFLPPKFAAGALVL
jgi:hypothetical protein